MSTWLHGGVMAGCGAAAAGPRTCPLLWPLAGGPYAAAPRSRAAASHAVEEEASAPVEALGVTSSELRPWAG